MKAINFAGFLQGIWLICSSMIKKQSPCRFLHKAIAVCKFIFLILSCYLDVAKVYTLEYAPYNLVEPTVLYALTL